MRLRPLACCAWQTGDGALANVAFDRALADNPGCSMHFSDSATSQTPSRRRLPSGWCGRPKGADRGEAHEPPPRVKSAAPSALNC